MRDAEDSVVGSGKQKLTVGWRDGEEAALDNGPWTIEKM